MCAVDGIRPPFLFLFNVTGLAHMTLSSRVGMVRVRAASPAGALELDLQDKKKKKKPSRNLIDISGLLLLLLLQHPPFIQSVPALICSCWWEELYQDAASLTSLSDRWKQNFKMSDRPRWIYPPPSHMSFFEHGQLYGSHLSEETVDLYQRKSRLFWFWLGSEHKLTQWRFKTILKMSGSLTANPSSPIRRRGR